MKEKNLYFATIFVLLAGVLFLAFLLQNKKAPKHTQSQYNQNNYTADKTSVKEETNKQILEEKPKEQPQSSPPLGTLSNDVYQQREAFITNIENVSGVDIIEVDIITVTLIPGPEYGTDGYDISNVNPKKRRYVISKDTEILDGRHSGLSPTNIITLYEVLGHTRSATGYLLNFIKISTNNKGLVTKIVIPYHP